MNNVEVAALIKACLQDCPGFSIQYRPHRNRFTRTMVDSFVIHYHNAYEPRCYDRTYFIGTKTVDDFLYVFQHLAEVLSVSVASDLSFKTIAKRWTFIKDTTSWEELKMLLTLNRLLVSNPSLI